MNQKLHHDPLDCPNNSNDTSQFESRLAPFSSSTRSRIPAFEVMRITEDIGSRRLSGQDIVSLCAGEPKPRPAPSRLKAAGYTGPLGLMSLREAICEHYRDWYDIELEPRTVALTTGSSGAFLLAFLAAFDAGHRVALAVPGYPAYRNILRTLGVEVVEITTGPSTRYQPTPEMLEKAVSEGGHIDGLILASPANPTGTMLSRVELSALVEWCRKRGTRVISDELYHGITFPESEDADSRGVTVRELDADAIVINSFSKYWGMTGWRLGWAILPEDLLGSFEALASNFALSPPTPAQEFALSAFTPECYAERDAILAEFARARRLLLDEEAQLNWGPSAPSEGAFYYYSDLGSQCERFGDSVSYSRALLDKTGVAVVPGIDFDPQAGGRSVRLSYAAGVDAVADALERIVRFQNRG